MTDYYAYTIGSNGHFKSRAVITTVDDENAKRIARQMLKGRTIELWEMSRFIERIEPDPSLARSAW
jgi:CheY-specific phosphatase CheX